MTYVNSATIHAATSMGRTPEQLALLEEFRRQLAARGHAPTRRELAAALRCNVNNVQQMLQRLRRDGVVEWVEGSGRTIREVV